MAFRQPAFAPQRPSIPQNLPQRTSSPSPRLQQIEESQEWILFPSRPIVSSTTGSRSSITERTAQTGAFSRQSDLQSFDSALRSGRLSEEVLEEHELDSLDVNLQAFRETHQYRPSSYSFDQNGGSVLPAHDGLGTFPSSHVQEQIWQHEQYNPKRKFEGDHRRRSSVQRRLDTIDEINTQAIDEEKRLRIEKWRHDQSKALLDEIERETRTKSRKEALNPTQSLPISQQDTLKESTSGSTPTQGVIHSMRNGEDQKVEPEAFWTRLTRRFIRDVIGIDDSLLAVILGEALPGDVMDDMPTPQLSAIPEQAVADISETLDLDARRRDRLLQRVARELGVLANQISSHPGAFSTYQENSPGDATPIATSSTRRMDGISEHTRGPATTSLNLASIDPSSPESMHNASWGMDDDEARDRRQRPLSRSAERTAPDGSECRRRDFDIKMLFEFLRERMALARVPAASHTPPTQHGQDQARRAALIRQHHPMVARAHQRSLVRLRRDASLHLVRRSSSSCASQSIRSSKRESLVRSRGSSRNYWDIGGSMGSESAIASGGMMGAWGEV